MISYPDHTAQHSSVHSSPVLVHRFSFNGSRALELTRRALRILWRRLPYSYLRHRLPRRCEPGQIGLHPCRRCGHTEPGSKITCSALSTRLDGLGRHCLSPPTRKERARPTGREFESIEALASGDQGMARLRARAAAPSRGGGSANGRGSANLGGSRRRLK